jgi:hypothetical protein
MKHSAFKTIAFLALALILANLTGCNLVLGGGDDPTDQNDIAEVDYTNYTTNYSVRIKNNASIDLVVFKGSVATSNIMGGVKAKESNHGMKKDPDLFAATGDFPLVFITEDQYNKNKSDLEILNQSPYARVYAFYNAQGTNETIYEVSGSFGGANELVINNLTTYTVELRRDGIYGEPLGFAGGGMNNQKFFLATDDYQLFPVFKKYIPNRDIIQTIYPKYSSGIPKSVSFGFGEENGNRYLLDVKDYFDLSATPMSTGAAYLVINNQSNTGIRLFKGGDYVTNSAGIATINNGLQKTFQIEMPSIPGTSNQAYATELTIAAYAVGEMGNNINIGAHTLLVDTIYTVDVTRNSDTGYFEYTFSETGKVSLDDFTTVQQQ